MKHLKDHASYVFARPKREPTSWTIACWSKMLSRPHTGSDCVPTRNLLLFWITRIMGYDSICWSNEFLRKNRVMEEEKAVEKQYCPWHFRNATTGMWHQWLWGVHMLSCISIYPKCSWSTCTWWDKKWNNGAWHFWPECSIFTSTIVRSMGTVCSCPHLEFDQANFLDTAIQKLRCELIDTIPVVKYVLSFLLFVIIVSGLGTSSTPCVTGNCSQKLDLFVSLYVFSTHPSYQGKVNNFVYFSPPHNNSTCYHLLYETPK